MFTQRVFNLVSRLVFSRWARGYEEYHGACEGRRHCSQCLAAFFGPLHLEINQCFVLDHDDAFISIRIPTPWGKLHLGYVICLGADEIRRPGFYSHWQKRLPKVVYGQACPPADDEYFPF